MYMYLYIMYCIYLEDLDVVLVDPDSVNLFSDGVKYGISRETQSHLQRERERGGGFSFFRNVGEITSMCRQWKPFLLPSNGCGYEFNVKHAYMYMYCLYVDTPPPRGQRTAVEDWPPSASP